MDCRKGCGACCIAPSITSPIPGMPQGKPAGARCVNLTDENECSLWGQPNYPEVCRGFAPSAWVCGETRNEALTLLTTLEASTQPLN